MTSLFTNINTCTDPLFISGTQHLYVLTHRISADAFIWNIADRKFSVEGRGLVAGVRSPLVNLSVLTLPFRLDSGQCCFVSVTCVSVNCIFGFGWTGKRYFGFICVSVYKFAFIIN